MMLAVTIVMAVGLHHHLKDKNDKVKRVPMVILSGLIVIFELFKQIRNFTGISYGNLIGYLVNDTVDGIDTYAFPFHFCSFFFFWQIAAICTKGKAQKFFDQMSFFWSVLIAVFLLIAPGSIWNGAMSHIKDFSNASQFSDTHTLVFHALAFTYFVFEVALKRTEFKAKDWWKGAVAFAGYATITIPAAFIFDANYCSVLEPTAPLPWLPIARQAGYGVYLPVLLITGMCAGIVLYFAIVGVRKLETFIKDDKWIEYGFLVFGLTVYPLTLILNPNNISGPIWFVIVLGWLIFNMLPALIIRIVKDAKNK